MVVFTQLGLQIANELVAVQVRHEPGVQLILADKIPKRWNSLCQHPQQLPQGPRLQFELGDAGARSRDAEKFDTHTLVRGALANTPSPRK